MRFCSAFLSLISDQLILDLVIKKIFHFNSIESIKSNFVCTVVSSYFSNSSFDMRVRLIRFAGVNHRTRKIISFIESLKLLLDKLLLARHSRK